MIQKRKTPTRATRPAKPLLPKGAARVIEPGAAAATAIIERPDGFYWVAANGLQEFGPFDSPELALADHDAYDEQAPAPGETLEEAERDLGINDWIDADTGEPAEGLSVPRLPPD